MRQHTFPGALIAALTVVFFGFGCANQAPRPTPAQRPMAASDEHRGPTLWPSSRDYYPSKAKRLGITGRVGIECSVDELGHARNIVILESADPLLNDAARDVISDQHFRMPSDWSTTGGPAKRFRYGVIFRLPGKPDIAPFEDNRQVVVITGPEN